jgi:hypothetical protein
MKLKHKGAPYTSIQVAMRVAQPSIMMRIAMCGGSYHGLSCSCSRSRYQIAVSRPGWRNGQRGTAIATASLINVLFFSILGRIKVARF